MSASVYICFNCPACERISKIIQDENLNCEVVNVQVEKPKIPRLQIFPALFIDGKLKAYGDDILDKLRA